MTDRPRKSPELARRDLLRGGALLLVAPAGVLSGCAKEEAPEVAPKPNAFLHGVASGDPLPDAVILWTRVTLPGEGKPVVKWELADDVTMARVVASGEVTTDAERDFTVKVDARGLAPGRTYFYRFHSGGAASPIGRTRTAPSGATPRLRLAVVSCASMAHGYFHGYRALAERLDLDAVLHLGDYIYEYANEDYGAVRSYEPPHETLSLADYRTRHGHYKLDADLQAVHRQHPFIAVWDDHEIANDAYKDGAQNHTESVEGAWVDRKAGAKRAYREWMPIREEADGHVYRKLAFGDLADLVMLDTRHWGRTKQAGGAVGAVPDPDPSRTLLGDDQAAWMEDTLKKSTAKWKLVGQQVMLGNLILAPGQIANLDQWHGYPESRTRLLSFLKDSAIANVVVLTGDIHSSWANEIVTNPEDPNAYDPATSRGSLAVEFVAPGITSPGIPPQLLPLVQSARPRNPHIRWFDTTKRGFVILDVTPERVQAAWFHFEAVDKAEPTAPTFAAAWAVPSGQTRLVEEAAAAADRPDAPPAAK